VSRRGLDRARVVAAAGDLADAQGLGAVTIARVAAGLGIRGPSVYNHVDGLPGLLRGIAAEALEELAARLRDAAVGRGGADALLAAAHAYRGFAREHPGRYAALQRAPARGDEATVVAAGAVVAVLRGILRAWALEGDEAVHAVRGLRSALHGFVDLERAGGFALDVDLDESFERLVRGFAAGLGPTTPPVSP
jgi:AcrR family transcriptional regulator